MVTITPPIRGAAASDGCRRLASALILFAGLFPALAARAQGTGSETVATPHEVRVLGGARAVSSPLETAAQLRTLVKELQPDFVALLAKAGWEGDAADLLRAIEEGPITKRTFPVGGRLRWMAYRSPAGIDLYRDVRWAGQEPFEAFEVRLVSNGWRWAFIVPQACGNLALLSRTGAGDLDVSVTSGVLKLTDPEGREIVVQGGESATVTAPLAAPGELRGGESGAETSLEVREGRVELRDWGHPIAVTVDGGHRVSATLTASGRLALAVPETNPGPLPIRVGDSAGTLSAGAGMSSGWSNADAEPPAVRISFNGPHLAPRFGLHSYWILGPDGEIEVTVADDGSGVDRWAPLIDGEQAPAAALRGPWTAGEHTVAIEAVDRAGNRRQTDPIAVVCDVDPPELSWGVEGLGPIGGAGEVPGDAAETPPPSLRGRRMLRAGGREWLLDSDSTQVVARPQGKRRHGLKGIDVPLSPERGIWILSQDRQCGDFGSLTYDLVEGDGAEVVLRIQAVDCAGNARRGAFPLTPAAKK